MQNYFYTFVNPIFTIGFRCRAKDMQIEYQFTLEGYVEGTCSGTEIITPTNEVPTNEDPATSLQLTVVTVFVSINSVLILVFMTAFACYKCGIWNRISSTQPAIRLRNLSPEY